MTNLNFLSAALIAAAIATPAMARESHVTLKHRANATAGERYVDGRLCQPAPAVAHLPRSPGITVRLANPRRLIDPSASRTRLHLKRSAGKRNFISPTSL